MHLTSATFLGLAIVFPALAASAKKESTLCGLKKLPKCSKAEVCIKPAPNVRCSADNIELCPGTCQPSCTLTTNVQPCHYDQRCQALPGFSIQQTGYCPDPVFCGGIGNIQCAGLDEICVDDPRDSCDPTTTGRDCGGICVLKEPEKRLCDSRGLPPCLAGETCVHDPKSGCGAAQDCPGVCTPKKLCATLAGLQCGQGERCVDDVGNLDCPGGIAADCPGICVPA
ncbi:MAG: hypothetical protein Q9166_007490 [cf. Caloplaca sp. 2 TL-2023]